MKLPPFRYTRAESVEAALQTLAEAGDDAKALAGGQSLLPAMAFRLARPAVLVDIDSVPGHDQVRRGADGAIHVGALVRHAALERERSLAGAPAVLREAARHVGHHPIRVRGTFGGSLAHADPAAELGVVAVALEAEVVARSDGRERRIPAGDFFVGPYMTALAADELVVGAVFPPSSGPAVAVFEEFSIRAGDFALASVCVALSLRDGRVTWARVGLGSVGATPLRAREAEAALLGSGADAEAAAAAADAAARECDPGSDVHATAEYRRELVAVLTRRAVRRARERAAA